MGRIKGTAEMFDAAVAAYNREDVHSSALMAVVRAVLDIVERDQRPRRGDEIETWLVRFRDSLAPSSECVTVDDLLAQYQMAAEQGVPLTEVCSVGDL